jgi:psp operon transcriptional activator
MNPQAPNIIGESAQLAAALDHISRLAAIDRSVLIIGERGTGKELAAERLHYLSPRWDKTFTKINCSAIAETLLESELFGHEAGAFTGATSSPMAAHCFSMNSPPCHCGCRKNCCG